MSEAEPSETDRLLDRLRARRGLARTAMVFERVWLALWPPLGFAGLFLCLALLGLPTLLPAWAHLLLLTVTIGAILASLARGLRSFHRVDEAAADRRLERDNGLAHRPLAVLADRPAQADPLSEALWGAHVARTLAQVRRLRVALPRPGLARHDRRALRCGLAVALVAALVIAGPQAPDRVLAALMPTLPAAASTPGAQLQVWITPPPYTNLAPMFLKPEGEAVSVPAGSHLTASLTGGSGGAPALVLGGKAEPFRALDAASYQADLDLDAGGRLTVRRDGSALAGWDLSVRANRSPMVAWTEPPGPAPRSLQTRLPWEASDDYGVVQLQAELRLADRSGRPPIVLSIPVPGGTAKSAKGVSLQDLTANPWAGLPVTGRLVARDAAGLAGISGDVSFALPERMFHHPLARALIAVRKMLSLEPDDRASAVAELDRLLLAPEAMGNDTGAFLNLADIYYRLVRDRSPEAVGQAQLLMWQLALHLEEGGSERTAHALDAAREAVRQALDKATQEPSAANRSELDQRLAELENAIQQHMAALLEQAQRQNAEVPYDPDAQHLDSRDMERMAEAAREAARGGRMDEARQRMAELEQMLDQLRNARPGQGPASAQNAEKRQRGRQQMGALQDMIARQGGLLDHAQSRAGQQGEQPNEPLSQLLPEWQRQWSLPQSGQPTDSGQRGTPPRSGGSKQQPDSGQSGREADRRVQQALRRALGELMQQFGDLTGQVPQSLADADQAMRDAGEALGTGRDGAAGQAEQQAIEALQKGGREMGQQMAKQFGPGQAGDGDDEGAPGAGMGMSLQGGHVDRGGFANGALPGQRGRGDKLDPLGRQLGQGTAGTDESDQVRVPEEMERQRTRAIQDELRRRGAERSRPQPELDYIDRLLKQF